MLIPIRPNASSDECRVDVERKRGGGLGVDDLGGACEGWKMRDLEYLMQVEGTFGGDRFTNEHSSTRSIHLGAML